MRTCPRVVGDGEDMKGPLWHKVNHTRTGLLRVLGRPEGPYGYQTPPGDALCAEFWKWDGSRTAKRGRARLRGEVMASKMTGVWRITVKVKLVSIFISSAPEGAND